MGKSGPSFCQELHTKNGLGLLLAHGHGPVGFAKPYLIFYPFHVWSYFWLRGFIQKVKLKVGNIILILTSIKIILFYFFYYFSFCSFCLLLSFSPSLLKLLSKLKLSSHSLLSSFFLLIFFSLSLIAETHLAQSSISSLTQRRSKLNSQPKLHRQSKLIEASSSPSDRFYKVVFCCYFTASPFLFCFVLFCFFLFEIQLFLFLDFVDFLFYFVVLLMGNVILLRRLVAEKIFPNERNHFFFFVISNFITQAPQGE